jgi:hypothetical protein
MPAAATSAHTMADSQASQDDVLAIATQEQRVCPLPQPCVRSATRQEPCGGWLRVITPLILSAWHGSKAGDTSRTQRSRLSPRSTFTHTTLRPSSGPASRGRLADPLWPPALHPMRSQPAA